MGFNKRHLTIEGIKRIYESSGYDGLVKYVEKPDALFTSSEETGMVIDILNSNNCETNKILKIEEILYGETDAGL